MSGVKRICRVDSGLSFFCFGGGGHHRDINGKEGARILTFLKVKIAKNIPQVQFPICP